MAKKLRVATVFSGIGSIEFALKRLNIPHSIVFACDNGERDIEYDKDVEMQSIRQLNNTNDKHRYVDELYKSRTKKTNFVQKTYLANYPQCPENRFFQDICLLDGTDFENQVDLFVGGSPCQSFSSVGFQHGLEDARGTLFYEYARLVKEMKPKVFIYENVRNLLKHDGGKTWEVIKGVFDSLDYNIDFRVLHAVDFGIPQKRSRVFVLGYRKDLKIKPELPQALLEKKKYTMQDFLLNNSAIGNFTYNQETGSIEVKKKKGKIDERYFLSDAVRNYVMKDGTKSWKQKAEIDLPVARTLLKTMGNRHRAGVDNYVTDNGRIRMLSEREALRLMGFTDDFKMPVSVAQAYKQAGNSIVVDIMMEIVKSIRNQQALK